MLSDYIGCMPSYLPLTYIPPQINSPISKTESLKNQFLNTIREETKNGLTYAEAVGALEVVKEIMLREAMKEYRNKSSSIGTPFLSLR